jgi:hypothetical protein
MAVVGDDDCCASQPGQPGFQPGNAVHIQIVGRFIEEQHVRLLEQQLGKAGPIALSLYAS